MVGALQEHTGAESKRHARLAGIYLSMVTFPEIVLPLMVPLLVISDKAAVPVAVDLKVSIRP